MGESGALFRKVGEEAMFMGEYQHNISTECELDKQGRVNIPNHLREYAKFIRDCVVIGVSNRVEIWGKEAWDEYCAQSQDSFAEIAEKLIDFDL